MQDTIEYTKSRMAFGQPLLNNQVNKNTTSDKLYHNQLILILIIWSDNIHFSLAKATINLNSWASMKNFKIKKSSNGN